MTRSTTLQNADLDRAIVETAQVAPWLVGPLRAVRDRGIGLMTIVDASSFWPAPNPRPMFVIVADDGPDARGPIGFDVGSMSRLFRDCGLVVINAAESYAAVFEAAAEQCAGERRSVVVETQPERQDHWISFALGAGKVQSDIVLCSVRGHEPSAPLTAVTCPDRTDRRAAASSEGGEAKSWCDGGRDRAGQLRVKPRF